MLINTKKLLNITRKCDKILYKLVSLTFRGRDKKRKQSEKCSRKL